MEITSSAQLKALEVGFATLYMSGFRMASPIAKRLATIKTSTTLENLMMYVGTLPRMTEWVGERTASTFSVYEHKVKNKDWQQMVPVSRNDIEDDVIGKYDELFSEMGRQSALLWDDVVAERLLAGESELTYDGQFYFDTDHPQDPAIASSPVQSNLFTSRPLNDDNYAYVRARMMSLKGPDGRPLGVRPSALIVSPDLEVTAKRIVQSTTTPVVYGTNTAAANVDNVNQGTAEVIVYPELTGTDWYMGALNGAIKPLVVWNRKAPRFVAKNQDTDDSVFFRKVFHYGADARGVGTYGPWFLMAKAKA
jgi:phage major head subunit gpT-like protein